MTEREIFQGALDCSDLDQRQVYLTQACGRDAALRARVEALLRSHDAASQFLRVPAAEQLDAGSSLPTVDLRGDEHLEDDALAEADLSFLTPSAQSGSLGTIGHYEILQLLGQGAFGLVFKAFDQKLHRQVAIKAMNPQLAATSPPRKRFLREARSAAAIKHENIVQVYSVEEQPLPYLVMELVDGQTLKEKLDGAGPLDVAEILHLGRQMASGLAAAHAQGLIHRDIKPGNILVEAGGEPRVKITDFGLARAADDATMTRTGVIAGTPMFMAPEQAQGLALDHRADLFSLGSVLYQMASGRPPFRGATAMAVLKRVTDETPRPIQEILADVPDWLCAIIAKLHAKKPEDRFQSAKEVADLLARCQASLQQQGRVELPDELARFMPNRVDETKPEPEIPSPTLEKPAARPNPRWRWTAAAAALVALVAALGMTEATGVTNVRGTVIRLFSPDGTLVVEVDDPDVSVSIDGEDMIITGAGVKELRLKPGQYTVLASKDGKVVRQELVTVTRNGRQVVRVSKEAGPAVAAGDRTLPRRYKNSLGMEFALVPKGKGWLGGGGGKVGDREVEFKEDFYLGVCEVTQEEWEKAMAANPSHFSRTRGGKDEVKDVSGAELAKFPVDSVSWDDAQVFLEALNQRDQQDGWHYRLPTAAEWEYACRGGPASAKVDHAFHYYFESPSNQLASNQANFRHDNAPLRPCPVGSYPPNRLGLHDMHGNIWEWCDDEAPPDPKDPRKLMRRLFRGGYYGAYSDGCRAAIQLPNPPSYRWIDMGLRVARVRIADPDRRAAEWVLSIGGQVGVNDMERMISAADDLPGTPFRLTNIRCGDNAKVTDEGLAECRGLRRLTHLYLTSSSVTDAGLAHFKDCVDLTYLNLASRAVTNNGLEHFKDCKKLTHIGINHMPAISDAGLAHLTVRPDLQHLRLWALPKVSDAALARFRGCTQLKVLALFDLQITDVGLENFQSRAATLIHINCKQVTDAGVAHFKQCKDLSTLNLGQTAIGDKTLEVVKQFTKLSGLILNDTRITDTGLNELVSLTQLRSLYLQSTKVSETAVKKLAAALPRCKIDWDGGVIEPTVAADPDRRAAEWVLSIGGQVGINGDPKMISDASALPAGPFHLTNIRCAELPRLTDEGLAMCQGLRHLTQLYLRGGPVTDAGLANFKECVDLTFLYISGCRAVTDAGLAHFKDCKKLTYIGIRYMPAVSDAGLAHLTVRPDLQTLILWSLPKISDAALARFRDCTQLKGLTLIDVQITDAGLEHFQGCATIHELHIGCKQVTDAGVAHFKQCKDLYQLDLSQTAVGDKTLEVVKQFTKLTAGLTLNGTQITDTGLNELVSLTQLRSLYLKGTKVSEAAVKKLAAALPRCKIDWDGGVIEPTVAADPDRLAAEFLLNHPRDHAITIQVNDANVRIGRVADLPDRPFQLTGVFVEWAKKMDDAGLANLKDCQHIKHLQLWGTLVTARGLTMFKDNRQLQLLSLSSDAIDDAALEHFQNAPLTSLALTSKNITDVGLAHLKNCRPLQSLSVRQTQTTDAGLARLPVSPQLKHLDLGNTVVTDQGLARFKDCLAIQNLALWGTRVTDAGLMHFKGCVALRELDLGNTKVGDSGLAQLENCAELSVLILANTAVSEACIDVLRRFGRLQFLNVRKTRLSAASVQKLAAALPQCKIEWDGGVIEPKK